MMFAPMLAKEKSRFARAKRLPVVVGRDLPWWLCRVVILFTLFTFYGNSDGFDCQSAALFGAPVITLGRGRRRVPKLVLDGRDVLPCFEEQASQGAPEVVPGGALSEGGLLEAFVQDLARGFVGDGTAGDDLAVFDDLAEDGAWVCAAQIDPLDEGGQGAVEQEDQALLVIARVTRAASRVPAGVGSSVQAWIRAARSSSGRWRPVGRRSPRAMSLSWSSTTRWACRAISSACSRGSCS